MLQFIVPASDLARLASKLFHWLAPSTQKGINYCNGATTDGGAQMQRSGSLFFFLIL
jgi:hypothetical protein